MNSRLYERIGFLIGKAGAATSTPLITAYVNPAPNFRRVLALFQLGDMAAETVDCAIYKASDSSGTGPASAKAATQLAAHATTSDYKAIAINLMNEEFDTAKPFLAGRCVTGDTTGGAVGIILLGGDARYGPLVDFDHANLVEEVE